MRKFEKGQGKSISSWSKVRVKQMNHIVEVVSVLKASNGLESLVRLNKHEYVNKETGEVLEYNLSENRGQNIAGLKDTFRKIRDLINNNFVGAGNELHLTLTYKENMKDTKQLHSDFKKFWQKYKRKYGDVDYLSVVEPQGRGAWHCHVLIRHNGVDKIFIPSAELEKMWGNGFIKIKTLNGVDNIGAYLSAYLGDVELTAETASIAVELQMHKKLVLKEVIQDGKSKAYIKGGRLHMYPPGMNLYRHSNGIQFPEVEEMSYKDIKKIVGMAVPNYSRTVTIYDDDKVLNEVTYEQYNRIRGEK